MNTDYFRKLLIKADNFFHIAVAFFLIAAASVILIRTGLLFADLSVISMIHVINNSLLLLIIMEIVWTIIRYLAKQEFSLNPFLFIGIIAGVRQLLVIEAERSFGEVELSVLHLAEIGLIAFMIFLLIIAHYIYNLSNKPTKKPSNE